MHSWCSSYLEKRPLGKFGRDETKFKLPLHHLFLILQVHIILGAALDLKWGVLGDLCTWGKNKESELPPNFIIVFTHWMCQSLENFEGFRLFLFYFRPKSNYYEYDYNSHGGHRDGLNPASFVSSTTSGSSGSQYYSSSDHHPSMYSLPRSTSGYP